MSRSVHRYGPVAQWMDGQRDHRTMGGRGLGGWAAGGQVDARCVGGPLTWLPPREEDRARGLLCEVSREPR